MLDWQTIKFANYDEYTDVGLQYHKNEICIFHFPNLEPRPTIVSKWRKGREYTDYNFEILRDDKDSHFSIPSYKTFSVYLSK